MTNPSYSVRQFRAGCALFLAFALAAPLQAADWPQWRGPARDGVAPGESLPSPLPKQLKRVWSVEVGEGHSSPVVADGRVFIHARQGESEVTSGFDAGTGKLLWSDQYEAPFKMDIAARGHGKGPKATITINDGRVYSFGISEILTCYEAETGNRLWRKDYKTEFGDAWPQFGTSSSVLVDGDLAIAQIGNAKKGALIAFDKKTGNQVWRTNDQPPAYASPMAFDLAGVRQVVTFTRDSFAGFDVKDGKQLWSLKFTTPYEQNIVTPVVYDGMLIYSGIEQGVFAIRLEKAGEGSDALKPVQVWKNADHNMYMNSPVVHGDHLYFMSNKKRGAITCVDLKTGSTVWESGGRFGANASIVLVGDTLLALNADAQLKAIAAAPSGYKELASWQVANSATWAHLAFANGKLYLKDRTNLICLEF